MTTAKKNTTKKAAHYPAKVLSRKTTSTKKAEPTKAELAAMKKKNKKK